MLLPYLVLVLCLFQFQFRCWEIWWHFGRVDIIDIPEQTHAMTKSASAKNWTFQKNWEFKKLAAHRAFRFIQKYYDSIRFSTSLPCRRI